MAVGRNYVKNNVATVYGFNPKVSIVIPVYNGSNYLKDAIDSAIAQTYKNIEIIVVNDGSNDNGATEKVAKSFGDKIRYYKKNNGGVSTALNLGIKKMTGEYFSWLSHDDMYYPNKVERQIEELEKQKNKKIILFSNYSLFENGKTTKVIFDHEMLVKKMKYSLLRGCVNGITPLIPKDIIDEMGWFDPTLRCTQDYVYWHKIQKKYSFVHMEDILAVTRLHPKQVAKLSPKVIPEGNALWIEMIKDLTNTEKIQYEGSLYNFYSETAKFLNLTPYKDALKYSEKQLGKIENRIFKIADKNDIGLDFRAYKSEKIKISEDENARLRVENADLAKLVNSKRYRFIDKVANIKNRIIK